MDRLSLRDLVRIHTYLLWRLLITRCLSHLIAILSTHYFLLRFFDISFPPQIQLVQVTLVEDAKETATASDGDNLGVASLDAGRGPGRGPGVKSQMGP